jgi:transcriptional regulator with XRE-family HTH domain
LKLTQLREVRELHGWSQSKLAEESGVSRDGISNYETGHREAWPATAKKLADALQAEISDLVARVEEPVLAGKAEAPPPGPKDEEANSTLIDANFLEGLAGLWETQLSQGQYDLDTLQEMHMLGGLVGLYHESNIAEYRDSLPSNFLRQLEAAEKRFIAIDSQIWETLEKTTRGHAPPPDELVAKRKERRQEWKDGRRVRHAQ